MKNILKTTTIALALTGLSFGASNAYAGNYAKMKKADIVETAVSNDNLSTLVAAVTQAGLVETLQGDGPFTVFAPTNAAFAKLPEGTVETLLKDENKDVLAGILTYHVVGAKVKAGKLGGLIQANGGNYTIETVNGDPLVASVVDGSVILTDTQGNTSTVIATDIKTSNGVVHVIDTVVLPN
jgi:uncharacterized surface protein with fasciclin (FAS1) repeats